MKGVSIIISLDQTLKDLELTLSNFYKGNFEKWGLKPVLPVRLSEAETYQEAAKRFWEESGWFERVQVMVPRIKKWWDETGIFFADAVAKDLRVEEPQQYYIILIPFGPGGSYNPKLSAVYVRINNLENTRWWQHVIVHEITHLLSAKLDIEDHKANEKRINTIMTNNLKRLNLEKLI